MWSDTSVREGAALATTAAMAAAMIEGFSDVRFPQSRTARQGLPGRQAGVCRRVVQIDKGEFVCIIGHSGCGKTTILNVLAGLDTATSGLCFMDGREIAGPQPGARRGVPEPRAHALAHGAAEHRVCRQVALARLEQGRR
jgi:nitrate/nitrite transport system ATP-binding protein